METTERRAPGSRRSRSLGTSGLILPVLAFLLVAATALDGQQRRDDCQCVDPDGNPIENCSCFRVIEPQDLFSVWGQGQARARIGVTVNTNQHARYERQGVHISDILENGPADEAGLEADDIITSIRGHSIFDALEDADLEEDLDLDQSIPVQRLLRLLREVDPGEEVEIEYLRDGEPRRALLTAEENSPAFVRAFTFRSDGLRGFERPDDWALELRDRVGDLRAWRFRTGSDSDAPNVFQFLGPEGQFRLQLDSLRGATAGDLPFMIRNLDPCFTGRSNALVWGLGCVDGVDLQELNPELGDYFGTDQGVLVTDVREESALGLRPGDVLLSIDGRTVDDAREVRRILQSYELDEDLTLRVMRRGEEIEVQGRRR